GDLVVMNAQGANFDLAAVGATFPAVDGSGGANATNVDSRFTWPLLCDNFNLAEQDSFRVYFFIEDFDKCEITNQDTLTVDFIIQPTPNTTPVITANLLNDFEVVNDTVNMFVDETLQISLIGTDFEGDSLLLEVLSDDGIMGYTFEGGVGRDQVNALFTWTPGCDVFTDDKFSESFELVFSIRDDNCSDPRANQISVFVNVKDLIEEGEFLPPNIFTPNGDDVNEFFGMYRLDKETLELTNILPVDNCAGVFEGVSVFNRWGKEVFSSVERDFRWYGDGVPAGVYFYYIKYTNREFQGSVSVVY
ncbi:MAG: gliding motility-associated C-terminal domain-containing protein, partial [Bacteroidota bacterium]